MLANFSYGTHFNWYDWVFLGIAFLIVYPDKMLDGIGERTGWSFRWIHVIWLVAGLISACYLLAWFLRRFYPELSWFSPLVAMVFVGLMRALVRWIGSWFGNDFGDGA